MHIYMYKIHVLLRLSYDKLCQEKDREINTLQQEIKKMKEEEEKRQQVSKSFSS